MNLSRHFLDKDLVISSSFPIIASKIKLTAYQIKCLTLLCQSILEPVYMDTPSLTITSGYRNKELNRLVGGYYDSDHMYAIAVDFTSSAPQLMLSRIIAKNLPYRQLIWYPEQQFVHCSINIPDRPYKHEVLVEKKGVVIPYASSI